QHHFGRGLVPTSENLGRSGVPPTHPALLEWLAARFAEGGFRLKDLHRSIVNSATYRQSGAAGESGAAMESEDLLLSRRPARLDAESLRDAMLTVSGELDLKMGGAYVPTRHGEDGQVIVDEK